MAVILLWLATMGWLVKSKVLPPFRTGEPPSYSIIHDQERPEPPVGWRLAVNDQPVGWALTTTEVQSDGLFAISSHVHFDELPLAQLTPGWLHSLLRLVDEPSLRQPMDAKSVLLLDSMGRLTRFESTVVLDAGRELVCLKGEIVGNQILLSVRSGEFLYRSEAYLPAKALIGDALQPQTRLPGLRQGQVWSVPVYSPLRPPNSPLEILHAEVEGYDMLPWENRVERVWLVVYKNDPGATLGSRKESRGRLWVRCDGTVLQQEVAILGTKLTFARMPDDEVPALQQMAQGEREAEARLEPLAVEHWPPDWPTFPFEQEKNPVAPLELPFRP